MTQVTVKKLALEVNTPVERLLQQMREAGLPHSSAEQVVTDEEKQKLLAHLKSSHGGKVEEPSKISLKRTTTSTLRVKKFWCCRVCFPRATTITHRAGTCATRRAPATPRTAPRAP